MRRTTLAPATATALLLLLTACGGGGGGGDGVASLDGGSDGDPAAATETTLSEEEQEEALVEWAECMRGEGVDVPDPKIGEGGGIQILIGEDGDDEGEDGGSGGPPDRAAFEEAIESCGEPPRIGGEFSEQDRREMQERSLAFAECMRENGIEDFPDPDFSDEGPGAAPAKRRNTTPQGEDGDDGDVGGAMIAGPFGEVDLSDPQVAAAFEACQEELGDELGPPVGRDERRGG